MNINERLVWLIFIMLNVSFLALFTLEAVRSIWIRCNPVLALHTTPTCFNNPHGGDLGIMFTSYLILAPLTLIILYKIFKPDNVLNDDRLPVEEIIREVEVPVIKEIIKEVPAPEKSINIHITNDGKSVSQIDSVNTE